MQHARASRSRWTSLLNSLSFLNILGNFFLFSMAIFNSSLLQKAHAWSACARRSFPRPKQHGWSGLRPLQYLGMAGCRSNGKHKPSYANANGINNNDWMKSSKLMAASNQFADLQYKFETWFSRPQGGVHAPYRSPDPNKLAIDQTASRVWQTLVRLWNAMLFCAFWIVATLAITQQVFRRLVRRCLVTTTNDIDNALALPACPFLRGLCLRAPA